MKRERKYRGQADKWERCTWDEAIDIIERNYREITGKYGRESSVIFAGTGREGGTLMPYGSMMLGTPISVIPNPVTPVMLHVWPRPPISWG